MTYFELVKKIKDILQNENADFEAKQIVTFALKTDTTGFMKLRNSKAQKEIIDKCYEMAKTRNSGVPLYYVLGVCEFYSLELFVGKGVLVPRDDTEILVDEALKELEDIKNPKVLDLCSGSGAIAIAIAKNRPDAMVHAVELYDEAYCYLEKNIKHNKANNVTAIKADALKFHGDYDLIVSNPPYIAESERTDLSKEVLNEPHSALFANNNGLEFYEKISKNFNADNNITVVFEIGYTMKNEVISILEKNGYSCINTVDDYGGNTRVIKAKKH